MNLQHCLVLTAAAGAVLMDLKTGEIANGWIVILWLAGFAAGGMSRGAVGFLTFLTGALLPILTLFWLFCFRMIGAGDIKLLSALGGFLGPAAILKCICLSFIFGAILSAGILLFCGNIRQRLLKFTTYFKHYILPKLQGKAVVPVPYRDGKWGMECIHFSVPILLSVLLWLGGFY